MKLSKHIIPEVILRAPSYAIKARMAVLGWLSGIHPSAFKGHSVEFSEHRPYTPGDELRYIDWRATAKFDRVLLKTFRQEASVNIYAIVDNSSSMNFSSHAVSKLEYALLLASSTLFIGAAQGDRVSFVHWGGSGALEVVPPSMGREGFIRCTHKMDTLEEAGSVNIPEFVFALCEMSPRRSIVFWFSDFLDFTDVEKKGVFLEFSRKEVDLRVVHVVDPVEEDFTIKGDVILKGTEGEGEVEVSASLVRDDYIAAFREFATSLEDEVYTAGGAYFKVRTDAPLEETFDKIFSPAQGR